MNSKKKLLVFIMSKEIQKKDGSPKVKCYVTFMSSKKKLLALICKKNLLCKILPERRMVC
nr:unnamed protein product [Callosobruchus analis]